jgi:hypothetical protein
LQKLVAGQLEPDPQKKKDLLTTKMWLWKLESIHYSCGCNVIMLPKGLRTEKNFFGGFIMQILSSVHRRTITLLWGILFKSDLTDCRDKRLKDSQKMENGTLLFLYI